MPNLTDEQLSGLAMSGALNHEINAALGRKMTDAEKQVVDRARVVWRLKRTAKRQKGPRSKAEQMRIQREAERGIDRRPCEDMARRTKLEADPVAWLAWYMAGSFPLSFSKAHIAIINGAIQAARSGTGVAVAAPRGEGKTTILRGVSLYLVATKQARFPVLAGWTHKAASEAFRTWLRMLHNSERYQADYPEMTQPFEESTHSTRLKNLTWSDTKEECGAEVRSVDKCLVLPSCIGAIAAASVQGDVKGLSVTLTDGTVLRPDLLLVDDAQDPKRAGQPEFVRGVIEALEKQWMCLAGPQSRVTTMVACTVAHADDVSEHFLSRPDFVSIRVARVESWPTGWANNGKSKLLWNEWHNVLVDGLMRFDAGAAGLKFYADNKAEMTEGMVVSWSERYDKKRGDPDAMYSAMFDLYRIGSKAFSSEFQNTPEKSETDLYDLSVALVCSRINNLARREVDESIKVITAFSDINFAGMWWAVVGFRNDRTGYILDYGKHPARGALVPKNATETQKKNLVATGVSTFLQMIAGMKFTKNGKPMSIRAVGVDRGFMPEVVHGITRIARYGFPVVPVWGFASTKYRADNKSLIGKPGHYVHFSDSKDGNFMASNTDYFKEVVQRGFLAVPGASGSLSIFGDKKNKHIELAEHICSETLVDKAEGSKGMFWKWRLNPGACNDGLDAVTGCFSVASWFLGVPDISESVSHGNAQARPVKKVLRRQTKVQIEE